jgi:hypothetical protein
MQAKADKAANYTEPQSVRRKLTEAYRRLAADQRFKTAERAAFARMADAWAATLPQ